jgi:hypothetical protein
MIAVPTSRKLTARQSRENGSASATNTRIPRAAWP